MGFLCRAFIGIRACYGSKQQIYSQRHTFPQNACRSKLISLCVSKIFLPFFFTGTKGTFKEKDSRSDRGKTLVSLQVNLLKDLSVYLRLGNIHRCNLKVELRVGIKFCLTRVTVDIKLVVLLFFIKCVCRIHKILLEGFL